ncbi:MAG: hypothetical protein V2B18_03070 [Pseudomonadota bacterium]
MKTRQYPQHRLCPPLDSQALEPPAGFAVARTAPKSSRRPFCIIVALIAFLLLFQPEPSLSWIGDLIGHGKGSNLFAIDPDLYIRRVDPRAPDNVWTLAEGRGVAPFYYRTTIPGLYDRVDFFFPLGLQEESTFQSRLKFFPFFENRWSKVAPYDGFSRCLTMYHGRSDMGQDYWGFFPFYGHSYRKFGVDRNFFVLFPLYYESVEDNIKTTRIMWPFITYANDPGRHSIKVWPLAGRDAIRNEYFNWYVLWPFFQHTLKHPGTEQWEKHTSSPFPLYINKENAYSTSTSILWPFLDYYHHYATGYKSYKFRGLFKYGSGGGITDIDIFYFYSYKRDERKGTEAAPGFVHVSGDEVFTEK